MSCVLLGIGTVHGKNHRPLERIKNPGIFAISALSFDECGNRPRQVEQFAEGQPERESIRT